MAAETGQLGPGSLQLVNLMWFVMGLIISVGQIALKKESNLGAYDA